MHRDQPTLADYAYDAAQTAKRETAELRAEIARLRAARGSWEDDARIWQAGMKRAEAEVARLRALLRVVHLDWAIHQSLAPGTVERVAAAAAAAPPPA